MVRPGLDSAAAIFVRTSDTYRLLPAAMQKKSRVFIELGLRQEQISPRQALPPGPPRLLFVGRLLYWKGVHIAIQALAKLVTRMPGASLTIVGSGPEEARLKRDVAAQGLTDSVKFIPWLPRAEMANVYDSHDMLVFPSLHDSGGTVVLEAISRGLPVICLDLGGPRHIVTPGGGVVVGTQGLNTAQVAQAMAQELYALFQNPARLGALSAGANARAGQFVLSDRVRSFYGQVDEFIRVPHANGAMPTHVPFLVPSANM
jgi:glycosyltransferase involved in cell wall biosynthesis